MAKTIEEVVSKKSKLEEAISKLEKSYGKGAVIMGNQKATKLPVVSSGSLGIDLALGVGGFPYGRIVEIIAPESCGKTTMCLHVIANAQKEGKKCAIIDMEHSLSAEYASNLEVDMSQVLLSQPSHGEEALEIAKELIGTGEIGVVMIDSVAALVPKAIVDGTIGDQRPASQARMMSQALAVLSPLAEKNNCLVLFTNQIRMKIGIMYGSPETPAGGEALKYYASIRIDMRKTADTEHELNKTRVKVIKNKCSKPMQTCEVELIWGKGFNQEGEIIDLAVDLDIIQKSGSWFSYKDSKIGQGIASVTKLLEDNPEMMEEIKAQVLDKIKNPQSEPEQITEQQNAG